MQENRFGCFEFEHVRRVGANMPKCESVNWYLFDPQSPLPSEWSPVPSSSDRFGVVGRALGPPQHPNPCSGDMLAPAGSAAVASLDVYIVIIIGDRNQASQIPLARQTNLLISWHIWWIFWSLSDPNVNMFVLRIISSSVSKPSPLSSIAAKMPASKTEFDIFWWRFWREWNEPLDTWTIFRILQYQ